ncbi:DNA polymerase-4 [Bauldia litoralis]|uniref:DNA polymerase IV n=2 Tax=Bauldia litoralis TaxID=665467 RepID=A0A1G6B7R9_9HYPH|nr:DNA polymerase-4 [Bauldia litoralis]
MAGGMPAGRIRSMIHRPAAAPAEAPGPGKNAMTSAPDHPPSLCCDCVSRAPATARRCPACGSPRLLAHPELDRLSIAHLDCDAFYAAIEKRDDPSLADKPVIIGGGRRGVVSTACYIARIRGVHSAMPMFQALKLCPDAVVIPPSMEKYGKVGREVRTLMQELTPLVEPISIDEAFLDLSGTEKLHHATPAESLGRLALRIERDLGITVSIGLSFNKFLAKIASDQNKPRGFSVIGQAESIDFLRDKPVGLIWGVGAKTREKLAADGIHTIGTLQRMSETDLARRYGSIGLRLARLARADDTRAVNPRDGAKSVSAETTLETDVSDPHKLKAILRKLSERVSQRLKKAELAGRTVTLKLKTGDFRTRTRSRQLVDPTRLADRIFQAGFHMLERETDGTRYRLIGIGVSDFDDPLLADPDDLVDTGSAKRARAEAAIDRIRDRFGNPAVETGLVFGEIRTNRAKPRRE